MGKGMKRIKAVKASAAPTSNKDGVRVIIKKSKNKLTDENIDRLVSFEEVKTYISFFEVPITKGQILSHFPSLNIATLNQYLNDKLIMDYRGKYLCYETLKVTEIDKSIAKGLMDIQIAVVVDNGIGIYHDKLGVMEDQDGNIITFSGSANSSMNGYENNYDRIKVFKSWDSGQVEFVKDDIEEFETLWAGSNPFVKTYKYTDAAKKNILEVVKRKGAASSGNAKKEFKLRPYQEEARDAWFENDCNGFLVMATGTGKTWTAIYSAKQLAEREDINIVICAPYIH